MSRILTITLAPFGAYWKLSRDGVIIPLTSAEIIMRPRGLTKFQATGYDPATQTKQSWTAYFVPSSAPISTELMLSSEPTTYKKPPAVGPPVEWLKHPYSWRAVVGYAQDLGHDTTAPYGDDKQFQFKCHRCPHRLDVDDGNVHDRSILDNPCSWLQHR